MALYDDVVSQFQNTSGMEVAPKINGRTITGPENLPPETVEEGVDVDRNLSDDEVAMLVLLMAGLTVNTVRVTRGENGITCRVAPYKQMQGTCPQGEQAHHIVPDWVLRNGTRAESKIGVNRIPGTPSYNDGMALCLKGNGGSKLSEDGNTVPGKEYNEHSSAHIITDTTIYGLGKYRGNPAGTVSALEATAASIVGASVAKRGCFKEIEEAVKQQWGRRDLTMRLNAVPKGNVPRIPEWMIKHFRGN